MITLKNVTKTFPGSTRPAVDDLTLVIERGEFVTLVGPSGCGKTTTLKMVNRLIEPTSGTIEVDGRDTQSVAPHELRRSIGYVIQQVGLFPHRTIFENIATVPSLVGWEEGRVQERVTQLTTLVGLDADLLGRYPSELSGGQQQRVGVARALAADPPVLLLDEPFGAVDPVVRGRLQEEFLTLQGRLAKTVMFVTHDIDEALLLGNRVVILNAGGIVEQVGTPEEILAEPVSEFVAGFLGGERGLRRLGLLGIDPASLERGPMVDRTATNAEAREVMSRYGVEWFGVLDGDRLSGWAEWSDLDSSTVDSVALRPIRSSVPSSASLRQALDAVVTGRNRLALVIDNGIFRGVLDIESIAEDITE